MVSYIGIIPARLGSARLPSKMLIPIQGKPLLQWTIENAQRFKGFSRLIVATDDQRIFDLAWALDCEALMTPKECQSGSERLAACLHELQGISSEALIVNIQGDWPLIAPETIKATITALEEDPSLAMSSAVTPLRTCEALFNPSIVKCVLDANHNALYFSRSPIPYPREIARSGPLPKTPMFYGHLGIYGYRASFLRRFPELPPAPLAQVEGLEQLKALEHGAPIRMRIVSDQLFGVDTPEDLNQFEEYLCNPNTSSLQAASSAL